MNLPDAQPPISGGALQLWAPAESELPMLAEVARAAYADHYLHYWEAEDNGRYYMDLSFSEAALRREYADPNVYLCGLKLAGELVGYLKINRVARSDDPPGLIGTELEKLYLRKAAAGRGLGSQAMAAADRIAIESGQGLIWLKVMAENHATVRFYQRLGFAAVHRFRIDIPHMHDHLRGMLVMARKL